MSRKHGIAATYRDGGCRCDLCREANTAKGKQERYSRAARLKANPTLAPHGTKYTYQNWRCRCGPCTAANSAASKEYKRRRKAGVNA